MNRDIINRLRRLADDLTGIADHAASGPESSDEPTAIARRLVDRFVAAIDAGDLDTAATLLHPDIVHVVSGRSRAAGIYEGIDAAKQAFTIAPRVGATDLRSKLTHLLAAPDEVATFHEISGTIDGRPFRFETALRFSVRDQRISEIYEYSADQHRSDDLFR